ncbi:MAG TPA: hypothetical protein VLB44_10560 [Kofleriaceae bacterium]|nr:hypothetical protein [Kofleriaceae bacterium]
MKISKRRRTAKKLVLPLIAIGLMTSMMAMEAANRPHSASSQTRGPAAARAAHSHTR